MGSCASRDAAIAGTAASSKQRPVGTHAGVRSSKASGLPPPAEARKAQPWPGFSSLSPSSNAGQFAASGACNGCTGVEDGGSMFLEVGEKVQPMQLGATGESPPASFAANVGHSPREQFNIAVVLGKSSHALCVCLVGATL